MGLPVRDVHPPVQTMLVLEGRVMGGGELTRTPVYRQCSRDSEHCATLGTSHSGPSRVCSFLSGTWKTECFTLIISNCREL